MTMHDVVDKTGCIRTLFDAWSDSVDVLVAFIKSIPLDAGCWWDSFVDRYS